MVPATGGGALHHTTTAVTSPPADTAASFSTVSHERRATSARMPDATSATATTRLRLPPVSRECGEISGDGENEHPFAGGARSALPRALCPPRRGGAGSGMASSSDDVEHAAAAMHWALAD